MIFRITKILLIPVLVFTFNNNLFSQWTQIPSGTSADLFDVQFINSQTGFIVGDQGKVISTFNGGLSWSTINLVNYYTNKFVSFINAGTGFISTSKEYIEPYNHYLYRTTNGGQNWNVVYDAGEHDISKINFSEIGQGYFSITRCDTLNISKIYRGLPQGPFYLVFSTVNCGIHSVKFKGNTGYGIGYTNGIIYKSTDFGNTWTEQYLPYTDSFYEMHMFNKDTVIITGSGGKILKTYNGGLNWIPINSGTSLDLGKFSFPNSLTGYLTTTYINILKTTDAGDSWRIYSTGFSNGLRGINFLSSDTGYVVGTNGLIIKTTNGAIGLQNISSEVPEKIELMQNYPNPFNPSTKIRFSIPSVRNGRDRSVQLIIYDGIGREVQLLFKGSVQPGTYEVDFNVVNLPSGVYYYKLSTENFEITKKMVFLK